MHSAQPDHNPLHAQHGAQKQGRVGEGVHRPMQCLPVQDAPKRVGLEEGSGCTQHPCHHVAMHAAATRHACSQDRHALHGLHIVSGVSPKCLGPLSISAAWHKQATAGWETRKPLRILTGTPHLHIGEHGANAN